MRPSPFRVSIPLLLCVSILLVSALAACASSPPSGTQTPTFVQNDLPYPSWWKNETTPCDTHKVPTSAPLNSQAFYRGVYACGKDGKSLDDLPTDDSTKVTPAGDWGEWEWQCVELSTRFMYLAYGVKPYNANGNEVVDHYTIQQYNPGNYNNPILVPVQNDGSSKTLPQPGDILSYRDTGNHFGHTSVVIDSQVNNGTGSITVLEQNRQDDPSGVISLPVRGGIVDPSNDGTSSPVEAWLHHTVDLTPQTAQPATKVQVHGEGFSPHETVLITFDDTTQVGTATADGAGVISTVITVPTGTTRGTHTVELAGQASRVSPKTVFYVENPANSSATQTPTPSLKLVVNPTSINVSSSHYSPICPGGSEDIWCMIVLSSPSSNTGNINWSASNSPQSIGIDPKSGTLAPGQQVKVTFFVPILDCSPDGLGAGTFIFTGGTEPVTVPWKCSD